MTRRLTLAIAILAVATLALLPGVASAQAGSPPAVAGVVLEAPAAPAAPSVSGDSLARTGSDAIPMAIAAVALVLVGTVLVVGTRRRRDGGSTSLV